MQTAPVSRARDAVARERQWTQAQLELMSVSRPSAPRGVFSQAWVGAWSVSQLRYMQIAPHSRRRLKSIFSDSGPYLYGGPYGTILSGRRQQYLLYGLFRLRRLAETCSKLASAQQSMLGGVKTGTGYSYVLRLDHSAKRR